jgi:hypothetical protein
MFVGSESLEEDADDPTALPDCWENAGTASDTSITIVIPSQAAG